jgi:hypothetical protein
VHVEAPAALGAHQRQQKLRHREIHGAALKNPGSFGGKGFGGRPSSASGTLEGALGLEDFGVKEREVGDVEGRREEQAVDDIEHAAMAREGQAGILDLGRAFELTFGQVAGGREDTEAEREREDVPPAEEGVDIVPEEL